MHYSRVNIFVKSLRDNSDAISLHNKNKKDQLKSDIFQSNIWQDNPWIEYGQINDDVTTIFSFEVRVHKVKAILNFKCIYGSPTAPLTCLYSLGRHQMETFSALLVLCVGISPVTGEVPSQRPVTRRVDVFFELRLNKRLSKQSWGRWFETPSRALWRHCNVKPFCKVFCVSDLVLWNYTTTQCGRLLKKRLKGQKFYTSNHGIKQRDST